MLSAPKLACIRVRPVYDPAQLHHCARVLMVEDVFPLEGGCTCRSVRFSMLTRPLFVHCCHCTWCQRETGSAFALNAMIEADRVVLLSGAVEVVPTPSNSGKG